VNVYGLSIIDITSVMSLSSARKFLSSLLILNFEGLISGGSFFGRSDSGSTISERSIIGCSETVRSFFVRSIFVCSESVRSEIEHPGTEPLIFKVLNFDSYSKANTSPLPVA